MAVDDVAVAVSDHSAHPAQLEDAQQTPPIAVQIADGDDPDVGGVVVVRRWERPVVDQWPLARIERIDPPDPLVCDAVVVPFEHLYLAENDL